MTARSPERRSGLRAGGKVALFVLMRVLPGLAAVSAGAQSAFALSELQPSPPAAAAPSLASPRSELRFPDSVPAEDAPLPGERDDPSEAPAPDIMRPDIPAGTELPEVVYDLARLPAPVRRMHELIVEACKSGDIEKLRPLIGTGADSTQLSLGGVEGDPIEFLREVSGDEKGQEILAILLEVMESGYVHLNAGEPSELFVWPYFFAYPLDRLNDRQRVELFTLVTAGDYQDMKTYGAYVFYRVGITPEGRWLFFVAGD